MSTETDTLVGIARILNDAGVATYAEAAGSEVVFGQLPPTPDRCIALTIYGTTDHGQVPNTTYRVQVYCRGGVGLRLDAGDLADAVFNALHGVQNYPLDNGNTLVFAQRKSSLPMGVDTDLRYERSENYVVSVSSPATTLRPN